MLIKEEFNIEKFNIMLNYTKSSQEYKKFQILEESNITHNNIIIYGTGNLGLMAKQFFEDIKIPIMYAMDKNPYQNSSHKEWKSIPIFEFDKSNILRKKNMLVIICIAKESFSKIKKELKEQGWENIVHFYDVTNIYKSIYPIDNGWYAKLSNEDIKYIKEVFSNLEDQISKYHYYQFIMWHTLRIEHNNKDTINYDDRYFISEVVNILTENETFVDIGAHHGEVIEKFIKIVNNNYNKIYAFEPDIKNCKILVKNLKNICDNKFICNKNKIFVFDTALDSFDSKEKENFYGGYDYISKLHKFGKSKVKVSRLNSLKSLYPTFIKIHTEGNELNIFKGGLLNIKINRPILTITTYHNKNGLWKLPLELMNSLKNYTYYFRLHNWAGTGSVIYAIPKERL